MTAIQCKIEIPAIEGLKDSELTVGREFLLVCEGEFPRDLVQEKLQFSLTPEQKYQIHLLGFEFRSATEADLKVTVYKTGQVQIDDLKLSDGAQVLSLGAVKFPVQSVLPQPQPGEAPAKQEPFGPIGPAQLSVPMLYWAILVGSLALLGLTVLTRFFRVMQRRKLIERLREHDSALSPVAEFHQSFRRLQRANSVFFGKEPQKQEIIEVLLETQKMFKLFITRQFQVPAMEWSDRLVMKEIKKYHKDIFEDCGEALAKLFHEYQRALQDQQKLTEVDVLNIATSLRRLVERMERLS